METKMKMWRRPAALVLILAMGLLVAGCESDPVAPQEEIPAQTQTEAAQQAALVAAGVAKIGPVILEDQTLKELGVYPYTFPEAGNVSGMVVMEYFTGGPEGAHSHWNDADYGMMYTPDEELVDVSVTLPFGEEGITVGFSLDFDLYGPINRAEDFATVSGTGNYITGAGVSPFTMTEVVVSGINDFPTGGTLLFETGIFAVEVTYNGTDTGMMAVNGVDLFTVDLDTGLITPITDS